MLPYLYATKFLYDKTEKELHSYEIIKTAAHRSAGDRICAFFHVLRSRKYHFPAVSGDGTVSYTHLQEIVKREVKRPFEIVGCEGKFDVIATVHGGGYTGQAGALRHGISRALCEADREAYSCLLYTSRCV